MSETQANLVKNIFGSDSDSDEPEIERDGATVSGDRLDQPQPEITHQRKSSLEEYSDDDDMDVARRAPSGPPLHLELPCAVPSVDVARGDGEEVKVAKLSNIFGVATDAFDRDTFVEETVEVVDADGISRVRMRDENVVRWRKNASTGEVESNARVVTWSDGSRQLVIGDEVLELTERAVGANEEAYLYLRRPGLMQSQGRLASKLTFRPATLESRTHKRLTAAIDKKHGYRGQRTMEYVSNVDPEKEKEQADAELEKAQRESAALARKQQRMMREDRERRYDASRPEAGYTENYYERREDAGPSTTAAARMDEDFLEADGDDHGADADDDAGAVDAATAANTGVEDEDEEAAAGEQKERRKRAFVESDSE